MSCASPSVFAVMQARPRCFHSDINCSVGLLEGAHAGRGLGHEFLRHCQRSRVLVHVVDGTSPDPLGDYTAIRTELELFNAALAEKPQVPAKGGCQCCAHAVAVEGACAACHVVPALRAAKLCCASSHGQVAL